MDIFELVYNLYGIKVISNKPINSGTALIYLINNKYILKVFQDKYTKDDILKEVTIINHLKKHNFKVPTYVKTLDGLYYGIYDNKVFIIQEYIDGYTKGNNEGTYKEVIESAKIYGKLVKALEDLSIDLPISDISNWYSKSSFEKSIEKHLEIIPLLKDSDIDNKIKKDILDKIDILNNIKNKDYSDMKYLTMANTHGDYNVRQFIYDNNHIKAILDFVSATKMPIVWEIIRSYSYIDINAKGGSFNIDTYKDYVYTFMKYYKLNNYDIKYMPYLYLIQILNSTYGYKEYINNNDTSLLEFAYFRTNICRYIYNNIDKLSNI